MVATSRVLLLILASTPLAGSQTRDASMVLADMRREMGGDAVLGGIRTFTVTGDVSKTRSRVTKNLSFELLAILPDHYMTIERDSDRGGTVDIDVAYFNGFAGDALIQRIESNVAAPFGSRPESSDAAAQAVLWQRRQFGLLTLALLGRSLDSYPWQLGTVGTNTIDGRPIEYLEARGADRFLARLYVDASTHLPIMIAWDAPPPDGGAMKLEFSDFKRQDGVTWPHRLKIVAQPEVREDIRLGRFRINQRLDPARFRE